MTLCSVLFLSFITACSSETSVETNGANNSEEADGGILKILLSEEPSSEDALNNSFKKWAEETGNKVDTIVIPYDDQITKFPLMLKNDDVPDLVSTTRLTRLYPEEFLDLTDVVDIGIFDQAALEIIGQDYDSDSNLALPNQYTITSYFYNADAFEEVGIEVPTIDDPWTMDELISNAQKLKDSGDVNYGLAVDFSRGRYDNLMYSNGGSITQETEDSFVVSINSEENVQTLENFVEWNETDLMPKVIWTGGSTDNPADYFKNGDVGIYLSGSWEYSPMYEEITAFDWGVMPSPIGSLQQSAIAGGGGLGIPSSAENPELAKEFLEWFYKEDNYVEFLAQDKGISFINGVTYEPEDEKVIADYEILQAEMKNVTDRFLVDEKSAWRNYLDSEYRDVIKRAVSGELTAKEALDVFANDLSEKSDWEIAN
ncbi:extracellular solute-binding protein [Salipaludibacillus neizhouensis]|uniref:extracellular solute-binding protein n=1 Tax=Salipaludibacillus neizhouensis TaxID=885475 RepID=UPI001C7CBB0F|nr:extracellular solute-binding protein [Salipaludibacillus neizhouensis]